MGRIVAISSGELSTTTAINRYAISLTEKNTPNLLFLGTATEDDEGYIQGIKSYFGELGCTVQALELVKKQYTDSEIDALLAWADIIYVGGGDTAFMIECWKKMGIDHKLCEIYHQDLAVLMGISAGAMCWFASGYSDIGTGCIFLENLLGLHEFAFCPHYEEEIRKGFDADLKSQHMKGYALDSETAIVDIQGELSIVGCREEANAYLLEYVDGELSKRKLDKIGLYTK